MGSTEDLHAGPGTIKLLLPDGEASLFRYETAVQLPDMEGFLVLPSLCPGPYSGPRGWAFSYERGTPVSTIPFDQGLIFKSSLL